jgi:hypothetical protein
MFNFIDVPTAALTATLVTVATALLFNIFRGKLIPNLVAGVVAAAGLVVLFWPVLGQLLGGPLGYLLTLVAGGVLMIVANREIGKRGKKGGGDA